MVLLFLTRQPEVCEEIALRLKDCGHIVSVYSAEEPFLAALEASAGSVGALCADYSFFDPTRRDLFGYVRERGWRVPVVFYNHPHPQPDSLAGFWLEQNMRLLPDSVSRIGEEELSLVLGQLQEIVTDSVLREHISLLCSPRPLAPGIMRPHETFSVQRFQIKHSVGPVKIRLFQKLYENLGCPVSARTLCEYLWGSATEQNLRTLYAYIHDVRRYCREESDYVMDVVRVGKQQYKLVFAEKESAVLHSIRAREAFEKKRYLFEGRTQKSSGNEHFDWGYTT